MKRKMKKIIPDYMEQFSCIGDRCEDNCCQEATWTIHIDKKTYKKYQNVKDSKVKKQLNGTIKRFKKDANDVKYAYIKLNEEKKCPLLDGGLCTVHRDLGESYLSNTCAVYPKTFNFVNGALEQSAIVSCPEVARLALLNPDGISFKEIEEEVDGRYLLSRMFRTDEEDVQNTPLQYFWELRLFTIQVLQNRKYSIDERMMILALFYNRMKEYEKENRVKDIPVLIGQYLNEMDGETFKTNFDTIQVSYETQLMLMKQMVQKRVEQQVNVRYSDCLKDTIEGLQLKEGLSHEEKIKNYQHALQNYYRPFMKEKEYILENFLVNYVFEKVFPYSIKHDMYDEFVVMVTRYAMIKLQLIGMSAHYKEKFDDELVIKCMQSFSRNVEHNALFSYQLYDALKEKELHTVGYLCTLLKN